MSPHQVRRDMQRLRAELGIPLVPPGRQVSTAGMMALAASATSKVMYVCINVQSAELISLNKCIN